MVAFSHFQFDYLIGHQTFFMSNMFPQAINFNQKIGSLSKIDSIINKIRGSVQEIHVYSGLIGATMHQSIFMSHGVQIPNQVWRVVYVIHDSLKEEVIGWIFPNDNTSIGKNINTFIETLNFIENRVYVGFALIPFKLKTLNKQQLLAQCITFCG